MPYIKYMRGFYEIYLNCLTYTLKRVNEKLCGSHLIFITKDPPSLLSSIPTCLSNSLILLIAQTYIITTTPMNADIAQTVHPSSELWAGAPKNVDFPKRRTDNYYVVPVKSFHQTIIAQIKEVQNKRPIIVFFKGARELNEFSQA